MAVSQTTSNSSAIASIQKEIKALQSDVTQENENKTDDAKTKAMKLMQYQLEITEDNLEIQQLSRSASTSDSASAGEAKPTLGSKIDLKA